MAACWSCQRIKGKRVCPARAGALICSKCCGTKRRVEIQCPPDCAYLHGADPSFRPEAQQREDARFLSRFVALDERQVVFLIFLHHLLLSAGRRFRALGDEALSEVAAAAAKTLSTRAKGIVYSHKTSSVLLDRNVEWLVRVLSERSRIRSAPEADDGDVVRVLESISRAISDHAGRESRRSGYLDTAAEVLRSALEGAPPVELPDDAADAPSSLIVPP